MQNIVRTYVCMYVCMYIGFDSWLHLFGFPFERTTRVRFGLGSLES